jgi:hypothetical protein
MILEILQYAHSEKQALDNLWANPCEESKSCWAALCKKNLKYISDFMQQYGWPSEAQYGREVENAAFLMVQHGDAGGLFGHEETLTIANEKQKILTAMQEGQANPGYVAFVTDRICWNRKEPQLYGTVPIADYPTQLPDTLEQRRASMGLQETQAQYLSRMAGGDSIPYRKIFDPTASAFESSLSCFVPAMPKSLFKAIE